MTPTEKDRARKMMQDGVSRKKIAATFGVSPQTISRICEGIKPPFEHRGAHNRKRPPGKRLYFRDEV